MCIISTIMESCPSTSSFYSSAAAKTQHNGMNNIIRLFLKKGLVSDLARVPHSLDLSRCARGLGARTPGFSPWFGLGSGTACQPSACGVARPPSQRSPGCCWLP